MICPRPLPSDLTFPDWVSHVFDHPVTDPAWHWADDAPYWDGEHDPARTVAYLTALFHEPDVCLSRFTPAQINEGLWYVVSPGLSDYACCVRDRNVPIAERIACVHAILDLYARLFACVCTHHYGHLNRGPELPSPLNSICYMFWDVFPVSPTLREEDVQGELRTLARKVLSQRVEPLGAEELLDRAAIESACLYAMERTLELDHPACWEGALHGLALFHHGYASRVEAAVDGFLHRTRSTLAPELRAYAFNARS